MLIIQSGRIVRPVRYGAHLARQGRASVTISRKRGCELDVDIQIPPGTQRVPKHAVAEIRPGSVTVRIRGFAPVTVNTPTPAGVEFDKGLAVLRGASPDTIGIMTHVRPPTGKLLLPGLVVDVSAARSGTLVTVFGPDGLTVHDGVAIGNEQATQYGPVLFRAEHLQIESRFKWRGVRPDEVPEMDDTYVRRVSRDGSFRFGTETYYLPQQYVGRVIILDIREGKLTGIYGYKSTAGEELEDIPLSELLQTRFYNLDTQTWETWYTKKISVSRIQGKRGLIVVQDAKKDVFYLGSRAAGHYQRVKLATGYGTRFLEVDHLHITGVRYYHAENANPANPPDSATILQRLYLGGKLNLTFQKPDNRVFSALGSTGSHVSHWQIPESDMFFWANTHRKLPGWGGLWLIVIGGPRGLRIQGYTQPESDPSVPPAREHFFTWAELKTREKET